MLLVFQDYTNENVDLKYQILVNNHELIWINGSLELAYTILRKKINLD